LLLDHLIVLLHMLSDDLLDGWQLCRGHKLRHLLLHPHIVLLIMHPVVLPVQGRHCGAENE
jgi:hypothetical protein